MKKIIYLLALLALMLTGCSHSHDEINSLCAENVQSKIEYFDGEWSVDQQVIDTTRMEYIEYNEKELIIELPEKYLLDLFMQGSDCHVKIHEVQIDYFLKRRGYSEDAVFFDLMMYYGFGDIGEGNYLNGRFYAEVDGKDDIFGIISSTLGNVVYRPKNEQYTIAVPVSSIIRLGDGYYERTEVKLPQPITLYYNTTKKTE